MRLRLIGCAATLLAITATAQAQEVSKAQWMQGMTTALPTAFCSSDTFFRSCFTVSPQKCEEVAASATRVCLQKFESSIPPVLHQPQDGTKWGTDVGSCAGGAFQAALSKEKINSDQCNDPSKWGQK